MPTEASQPSPDDVQGWISWGSDIGRGWAETIGGVASGTNGAAGTTTGTTTVVVERRDPPPDGLSAGAKLAIGAGSGMGAAYLANRNPLIGGAVGAVIGWAWSGGIERFERGS